MSEWAGIDALIKRHFTWLVLALVALAAFFQASGIAELVGSALTLDEATLTRIPRPAAGPVELRNRRELISGEPIRERNPFDSVTGPLLPRPAEGVTPAPVGPQDPLRVADCDGIRVAIVSESLEPTRSLAAMAAPSAPGVLLYRVGDKVGDLTVVYIGNNPLRRTPAVWLSGGAGLCQAALFTSSVSVPPPMPEPSPPTPAPAPQTAPAGEVAASGETPPHMQPVDGALAERIRKAGENEAIIARDSIDQVLRDPQALMPDTRIFAEKQNEQVVGIRVFGIRPETLLGSLGFQSGDRFESINGAPVTTPDEARRAFEGLRSGKLEVQVTRRGKPTTVTVRAE
jgi:general secretion pathway protein C